MSRLRRKPAFPFKGGSHPSRRSTHRGAPDLSKRCDAFPLSPRAEHYPRVLDGMPRIPTGFHPSAQGCEERATLGWAKKDGPTLQGLHPGDVPAARRDATPLGLGINFPKSTQGRRGRANPGLKDAIPLRLVEQRHRLVGNAQPPGRGSIVRRAGTTLQQLTFFAPAVRSSQNGSLPFAALTTLAP
jgi:hypothetical protein